MGAEAPGGPGGLHRPAVLAACMLTTFMAAVEATIVATAMPTIIGDLGGFDLFSWVFALYLLTQAISIPIYGKLADMHGRKPVLFAGVGLFLTSSTLAGFAHNMVQLIALRALQGLGAGAIQPIATTIIGDIYSGAQRGRVQGYISSVWGFSSVVGPALGAFFVERLSWSLVFWVNLPVGLVAMSLLARYLREDVRHQRHRVDYAGALLLVSATTMLMLALIQGAALPGPWLVLLFAGAAACLAGFLRVESRAREPIMSFGLWRVAAIVNGNLGQLASGAVMIAVTTFIPTYVQGVMGRSAMAAGFSLSAMSVGWPLAATVAGRLMARWSFRRTALTGTAALFSGALVLSALSPARGLAWVAAGSFLVGFGMGFCNTTFVVAAQSAVAWRARGATTSMSLFMRMLGQSIGAALYGALLNFELARYAPGAASEVNRMLLPAMRRALPSTQLDVLTGVIATALWHVYLIAALLALLAMFFAARFPRGLDVYGASDAEVR